MYSKKRKHGSGHATKYYAVKAGHTVGVFTTWPECQKSITGYSGSVHKSFPTEQEAKDFVAGRVSKPSAPLPPTSKFTSSSSASASGSESRFYGVAVGHNPGVYTDWSSAEAQIRGMKGPKYKKFATRAEAEDFVRSGGGVLNIEPRGKEASEPPAKKAKTGPATTLSKTAASFLSAGIALNEEAGGGESGTGEIRVYTDGSALGNGKTGALAGVGVFFGVDDPRNVSEPLLGSPQTNQRAELTAVLRALQIVPKDRDIRIVTDSSYSINCATAWYRKWMKNAWKNSKGEDVSNVDLVKAIRTLIDGRDVAGGTTEFEWVKGHSNHPSNEAADRLAVAGARMSRH